MFRKTFLYRQFTALPINIALQQATCNQLNELRDKQQSFFIASKSLRLHGVEKNLNFVKPYFGRKTKRKLSFCLTKKV